MDAKLVFDEKYYYLEVQHERIGKMIVGSSDHELSRIVNHPFKLSTKNCEVIKNDYDLDELAHNHAEGNDNYLTAENSFIEGAKTILELLGDSGTSSKKFSEDDIRKAIDKGIEIGSSNCRWDLEKHDYIQSLLEGRLRQTEFDVEIVMEQDYLKWKQSDIEDIKDCLVPKLDANGCIILKRK